MSAQSLVWLVFGVQYPAYYFSNFLAMASPFLGRDYRENMPESLQGSKDWLHDREKEDTAYTKANGVCTNQLD